MVIGLLKLQIILLTYYFSRYILLNRLWNFRWCQHNWREHNS